MIISKTPYRISFFGGGTDYPEFYRKHGGNVLSTSINKYCYISCRHLPPFFDHKYRIAYSKIEHAKTLSDIKHPAVRGVLSYLDVKKGLEIHHDGDLPARSGLGSSSSFVVGLMNAIHALHGKYSPNNELARQAIYVEQSLLSEAVGSQDQIAAAYGGFNKIIFNENDTFSVHPLIFSAERKAQLEKNLLLFFTGITRLSSPVAQKKIANFEAKQSQLIEMKSMVSEGIKILGDAARPLTEFGDLLHQAWVRKRELADGVTNSEIDTIYQAGLAAGAVGGKLLGAGGGGFMLFYVDEDKHQSVIEALAPLVYVPFKFDNEGSSIAFCQPASD